MLRKIALCYVIKNEYLENTKNYKKKKLMKKNMLHKRQKMKINKLRHLN